MDAKVSIVIPVYNVSRYIDRCLLSVVNQTYRNLEIILINDGSTDDSEVKCLIWRKKDSRIIYVRKQNEGLGSTRNYGVKLASGDYIAFLDSDDWIDTTFVEKLVHSIVKNDADMVFCDYYKVDDKTGKTFAFNTKLYTQEVTSISEQPELLYGADVAMWIKLYKRELLISSNIVIPDIAYEDTSTYAMIAASCNRIAHVKEKLLYYRINRDGSILNNIENRKHAVEALRYVCDEMKKRNQFIKYKRYLERFAVRFTSFSVRELKRIDNSEKYINELISFLSEYFYGWETPYGMKFCTLGSNNLYCMVNQIPFDIDNVTRSSMTDVIKYNKIEVLADTDFLFIDAQPNDMDTEISYEDIENVLNLAKEYTSLKIILIKNLLSEKYGEYYSDNEFEDKELIRLKNAKINDIYKRIASKYKDIKIIDGNDSKSYFSDINSRHGCSPCHLNDIFFTEMADRIIGVIRLT
ncbi:glycosyltransferase family 2 protein [Candidatus Clostridium helianthi]|uniref:Glycosyltransferase family 2 protein n=1 Tax=Candidatus Clostridium helianthi TaxID=3381660 RepID=A0ABW8S5G7_9CLOT